MRILILRALSVLQGYSVNTDPAIEQMR